MPSNLLRRRSALATDGATLRVDPATEPADLGGRGWEWVSFSAHDLKRGSRIERPGDGQEVAVVVLNGTVALAAGGRRFCEVGGRGSVFDAAPSPLLLVAPGEPLEIEARDEATIVVAAAPGGDVAVTAFVQVAAGLNKGSRTLADNGAYESLLLAMTVTVRRSLISKSTFLLIV
jgi:5-deoxy-D-glucuronate isomerase